MPTRSRVLSKSTTNRSHSSQESKQPQPIQDITRAPTMDVLDVAQPYFSFPLSLPHRQSNRGHEITQWMVAKHGASYEETSYSRGQVYMPHSDASFLADDARTTSVLPWDNALPLDNLILDQCQPLMNDDLYHLSQSSGSSGHRSQPILDPLTIDPAISLPGTSYPELNAIAVDMTDNSFKSGFASGSISYDSSSSIYMSPPVSPELEGQNFPGLPAEYNMNGDYANHGAANFLFDNLGGFTQRPLSPPSPPLSDSDPRVAFATGQQSLCRSQNFIEMSTQESGDYTTNSTRSPCHGSESTVSGPLVPVSRSIGQGSIQTSRPAPRILKPASERPRGLDQISQAVASSAQTRPKEKPEAVQPRNHHLYKASPGKDGMFICPFAKETLCAHAPTKQKCGYDKYLDSHLKPYQCKHADCGELKFSSNACLFRHEREAHGMHFYGKNPHRCRYAGCDRAIEGFPRRWNLHDHMRRVHKHNATESMDVKEDYSDCEVPSKRKGSGAPTSCKMKRTSSSQAKARAASASYSRDDYEPLDLSYQARQTQTRRKSHVQERNLDLQQTINFANPFLSGPQQLAYGDDASRMSYGSSHV